MAAAAWQEGASSGVGGGGMWEAREVMGGWVGSGRGGGVGGGRVGAGAWWWGRGAERI